MSGVVRTSMTRSFPEDTVADLRASTAGRDRSAMARAEVEQALAWLSRVKRRSEILETELVGPRFRARRPQRRMSQTAPRVERELAPVDPARAVGEGKVEVSR